MSFPRVSRVHHRWYLHLLRLRPNIGVENQDAFITICRWHIYSRHIRDILHLKCE